MKRSSRESSGSPKSSRLGEFVLEEKLRQEANIHMNRNDYGLYIYIYIYVIVFLSISDDCATTSNSIRLVERMGSSKWYHDATKLRTLSDRGSKRP